MLYRRRSDDRGMKKAPRSARRPPLRLACPEAWLGGSGIHGVEELGVVLGVAELVEQEVDRVHGTHRIEDPAQHIHLLQKLRIGDQLFLARAGSRDVDRREGPLV